jgi:hypothetical protein
VGPSLVRDVFEERKISCPDQDSNSEISSNDLKADAGMRQMAHSIKSELYQQESREELESDSA